MVTNEWLTGWKEIAAFLRITERTAKTWHYRYSMPISKLPTGTVQALTPEIDHWRRNWEQILRKKKTK